MMQLSHLAEALCRRLHIDVRHCLLPLSWGAHEQVEGLHGCLVDLQRQAVSAKPAAAI